MTVMRTRFIRFSSFLLQANTLKKNFKIADRRLKLVFVIIEKKMDNKHNEEKPKQHINERQFEMELPASQILAETDKPKTTYRREIGAELKGMGKTWRRLEKTARDRQS
ncbi:hypothetical protein PoB_005873200 [Plakobranchus ocellatus]|uniref:Uncharacterized protein n=1 Tax=Plakobranchus ocellatus TaxID=259542 RepID=A0AAV4CKX1_9GAST|nr:hypothetical protein PoB_005873200 [Plakobranchus ocellatus]